MQAILNGFRYILWTKLNEAKVNGSGPQRQIVAFSLLAALLNWLILHVVEISNTELRTFNLIIHHLRLISAITDNLSGRLLHFPPTQQSCQTISEISHTLLCSGLNTKAMECRNDGFTPLKTFELRATRLRQISSFQDKKKRRRGLWYPLKQRDKHKANALSCLAMMLQLRSGVK